MRQHRKAKQHGKAHCGILPGLALLVLLADPGCVTSPAENAGPHHRLGQDAFVVFTSPVQIPAAAARDAALWNPSGGISAAFFPLTFPLYLIEHTLLTTVHVGDMLAYPYHAFQESQPLDWYDTRNFPMKGTREGLDTIDVGTMAVIAITASIALAILSFAAL